MTHTNSAVQTLISKVIGDPQAEHADVFRHMLQAGLQDLIEAEVDLAIPKLRQGSFFPSLLNPRRRVAKALYAVICQAWIDGVSTRKVDDLIRALGNESGISRSIVSRICAEIDDSVHGFLHRRLEYTWFPYLYLDATYVDVRHQGRVISQAVVIATGVSIEGRREILGMSVGDSENTDF